MMPWVARHITYPLYRLYRRRLGERLSGCLEELERTQWHSREQLIDLQRRKLRRLLRHCHQNVPYYRRLFDERGIGAEDVETLDDLCQLPLLTKSDLREDQDALRARTLERPYFEEQTSGSSGTPVLFEIDRVASAYHTAAQERGRRWWGWEVGEKNVWLWGGLGNIHRLRRAKRRLAESSIYLSVYDLDPDSLHGYYRRLAQYRPCYMYGFTSGVYALAKHIQQEGLDGGALGLEGVFVTAELLYPHQRATIEAAFECPVVNEYGCSEVGVIAFQCPEGEMHVTSENVWLEFVRDGRPAEPGEMAEIVVTDLNNYRMPLVRYALGDVGCWKDGACDCGRGLPLMEISVGRVGDLIQLSNGRKLHPDVLDLPHDDGVLFDNVRQYRIVQQSLTDFSIQMEVVPGSEALVREHFARFVKERLGQEMRLDFAFLAEIPRERSGKLRYFVSALDTPHRI